MNILQLVQNCQVEWKSLGEVAELKRGKTITAKNAIDGDVPVISGGQKPAYYHNQANRDGETITIAGSGAYAGFVMYWNKPIFVSDAFSIKPNPSLLITRYVYHFLMSNQNIIFAMKKGSGVPHVYPKDVSVLKIPIPPLEIQEKIVKILDKLTKLTAELTAEHALRKKQCQYYRDLLLDFDNLNNPFAKGVDVEWKTLGEIVPLQRGKRLIKSQLNENGQFAVFQNSLQPLGYYNEANCRAYMTFIISAGAAGEIGFSHKSFWAADDCYYFDCPKDFLNDRFLYYFLMTQKHKLTSQVRKASVPRLGRGIIEKINIPIPPIETQAQIVTILDKFDTLTHSISEGLPREIELRQKQYEYYRELLLDFNMES